MADLITLSQASIVRHQPELMREEQAKADAIIEYAAKIKDWPLLYDAIDLKIEEQCEFVAGWDQRVRSEGRPKKTIPDPGSFSVAQLEDLTKIQDSQVSRWRTATANNDDITRYREKQIISALRKAGLEAEANHRAEGTGENEWFTPPEYIEAARAVLGEIDLDPATHPTAQQWIKAQRYFTRADDGLNHDWHGRVWLNPPYARNEIGPFINKLTTEIIKQHTQSAILLTHNYTDTEWFHQATGLADAICFTRGRVRFVDDHANPCAPTQGQTFFYYGHSQDRFAANFTRFGALLQRYEQ